MSLAEQLWFPFGWAAPPPAPPDGKEPVVRRSQPRGLRALPMRGDPVQSVIPIVRLWEGAPDKGRKCSPFARARTINVGKLRKREREGAYSRAFWDVDIDRLRPKKREDCVAGPRPCPWIGCRYHTAITVDEERGSIKEHFPQLQILKNPEGDGLLALEQLVGTCVLDIVERHDDGTNGLGGLVSLYRGAIDGRPVGQTPGMTIEEVAKVMNLSIERIRQLGSGAMQEVRVKLRRLEK